MKLSKRRKVIWGLTAVFLLAAVLSRNVSKSIVEVPSPNRQLAVHITETAGWDKLFSVPKYFVEVVDIRTGKRAVAMEQDQISGWHSFSLAGVKWNSNSQQFHCDWWIHEHSEKMSYTFQVKQNPLIVIKSGDSGHTH
jgi:hypothetical protein